MDATPDTEVAPSAIARLHLEAKTASTAVGDTLLSPPDISLTSTTPGDEEATDLPVDTTPNVDIGQKTQLPSSNCVPSGDQMEKLLEAAVEATVEVDPQRTTVGWKENKSLGNQNISVLSSSSQEEKEDQNSLEDSGLHGLGGLEKEDGLSRMSTSTKTLISSKTQGNLILHLVST